MSNSINAKLAKSVSAAIGGDIKLIGQWQTVGQDARDVYETESALLEAKAFFLESYIVPAMPNAVRILAVVQLRKGSPQYLEACAQDGTYKEKHTAVDNAKKSIRAMAHTYFARIVKYAFPSEAGASSPRNLKTRIQEEVAALIKACQKSEDANFNFPRVIAALDTVLTELNAKD